MLNLIFDKLWCESGFNLVLASTFDLLAAIHVLSFKIQLCLLF